MRTVQSCHLPELNLLRQSTEQNNPFGISFLHTLQFNSDIQRKKLKGTKHLCTFQNNLRSPYSLDSYERSPLHTRIPLSSFMILPSFPSDYVS